MSQQFKEFQVNGYTKREVQAFLDVTNAQHQCIEDWNGAYTDPGMDVTGWGTTDISSKRLNRLADSMGVGLIDIHTVKFSGLIIPAS